MKSLLKKVAVGASVVGMAFAPLAMATTYFTIPSPSSISSSTAPYSVEIFDSFAPVIYLIVGVFVGALAIHLVARNFKKGAAMVLGGRRGRRGRRR